MTNDGNNPFWTTAIKPDSTIYLKGDYNISESILEKLVGAMKIAEFAENEHEAAVGAGKVQLLIQKHNIDMGDITFADNERPEVLEKFWYSTGKNKNLVLASLANALGTYNFVSVYTTSHFLPIAGVSYRTEELFAIGFVGREKNVDMVMDLFTTIRIRLNKLADIAFQAYVNETTKNNSKHEHGKAWKASWLLGAISGIREVLAIQQREFEDMVSANGNTGRELVVSLKAENKEYLKKYQMTKNHSAKISSGSAYRAGQEAGRALGIKPVIGR